MAITNLGEFINRRQPSPFSKEQRADTDDEEGTRRRVVAREGKACAGLAGRDVAYAEGAADFGCLVGSGGEVMTAKKPWSVPGCSFN